MGKRKQDPSKAGLSAADIQGQGTTNRETGNVKKDSARKKQRGPQN